MVYSNYSNWWYHIWLVVWNMNFNFTFSWEFHNPNWLIFFRGVRIPPTRYLTEKIGWFENFTEQVFSLLSMQKGRLSSACSLFFNGGTGCIRCLVNVRWLKWHWVNTLRSSRIAIEYYYNGGFNGKIIYNLQLLLIIISVNDMSTEHWVTKSYFWPLGVEFQPQLEAKLRALDLWVCKQDFTALGWLQFHRVLVMWGPIVG